MTKSQIASSKQIPILEISNPQTAAFGGSGNWSLEFVCDLLLAIWCLWVRQNFQADRTCPMIFPWSPHPDLDDQATEHDERATDQETWRRMFTEERQAH